MLVTSEPLSKAISGASVTPSMKAEFDAERKRRKLTIAQANREAWAAWITDSQKKGT